MQEKLRAAIVVGKKSLGASVELKHDRDAAGSRKKALKRYEAMVEVDKFCHRRSCDERRCRCETKLGQFRLDADWPIGKYSLSDSGTIIT